MSPRPAVRLSPKATIFGRLLFVEAGEACGFCAVAFELLSVVPEPQAVDNVTKKSKRAIR